MSTTRYFDLGVVLSLTTGKMVTKEGRASVKDLVDFLTKDAGPEVVTLADLVTAAREKVLGQYPDLASAVVPSFRTEEDIWEWVDSLRFDYGGKVYLTGV
jgi:hypothetical protein